MSAARTRQRRRRSSGRDPKTVAFTVAALIILAGLFAGVLITHTRGKQQPALPTITLTPNAGRPGQTVQVTGSAYQPGETVALVFNDKSLGTAVADGRGAWQSSFVIPRLPANGYLFTGTGLSSGRRISVTLSVEK